MAQVVRRPTASGESRYDVRTRIAGRVVTKTFRRRKDAEAYANSVEAEKLRGVAVDPRLARVELAKWASAWMAQRVDLRPKTRQLYGYLLNSFVLPRLGTTPLAQLTPSVVRAWHAQLATERPRIAPKAYQVLRSCLSTAVTDGLLAVNPCRVKGAGQAHSPERPVASMAEAEALAANIDEHLRVMVLLAYWCSLRIGELRGLRRRDIDLLHGWIEVREQVVEVAGTLSTGPTKTAAGRRRIAIPPHVRADVERHLSEWVDSSVDAYVFTGARGAAPLPAASWQRAWNAARAATGLRHLHFHDLRHAGNTLAAATGASTRELMARMGHSTPRAALIYQHATSDRDQAIAAALSELATTSVARSARDGRAMGISGVGQAADPAGA